MAAISRENASMRLTLAVGESRSCTMSETKSTPKLLCRFDPTSPGGMAQASLRTR
jgi:hypothetical protein